MIQLISPKILDKSHKRCWNYEVLNVILPISKVTKLHNFKQCQFQIISHIWKLEFNKYLISKLLTYFHNYIIIHRWITIQYVSIHVYRNVMQLEQSDVEEFNHVSQRTCMNYVLSMRSRCRAVIKANGGHTRY